MAKKTGFILHYDMLENIKLLGNDIAIEILTALSNFDQGLDIGVLSPQAKCVVNAYIPALKKSKIRWETSVKNGSQHQSNNLPEPDKNQQEPNSNLPEPNDNPSTSQSNFKSGVPVPALDPIPVNDNAKDKDKNMVFSKNSTQIIKNDEIPPDKPITKREDAITVWNKAREHWNKFNLKPEERNLMFKNSDTEEILRTFQHYSWDEIKNAIENFVWHRTRAGPGYRPPSPYGSLAGFLKSGVERYFDDKALDQQFKEDKK